MREKYCFSVETITHCADYSLGYSLWLIPSSLPTTTTTLQSTITQLSSLNTTHPFPPHITLLTQIHLTLPHIFTHLNHALTLYHSTTPHPLILTFNLDNLGTAPTPLYYQYIYLSLSLSSHPSLASLQHAFRSTFFPASAEKEDDYFPHLSLLYGSDEDGSGTNAEEIIRRLKEKGGALWDMREDKMEMEMEIEEVVVVDTEGEVGEWKIVGRAKLG